MSCIRDCLSEQDLESGLTRLSNAFRGDYKPHAILEGSSPIGSMRFENDKIYLTFRGAVNSFREPLSCLDIRKVSADRWGLPGQVHSGLHVSFCHVHPSIDTYLTNLSETRDITNIPVMIEGYSRGAGMAMLTAAHLVHRYALRNITLVTHSPMNLFNQEAANSFKEKIKNQWNFSCKSDIILKWIGSSWFGFYPSGNNIEFSTELSESFAERIRKKAYTHLIRPALIWPLLRCLMPLGLWEAHMLETYQDGSIRAFQNLS